MSPAFFEQRADSGLAKEYAVLSNAVSYLHDVTEQLMQITLSNVEEPVDILKSLYPVLAINFHNLELLLVRSQDVGHMNHANRVVATSAVQFVRANNPVASTPLR